MSYSTIKCQNAELENYDFDSDTVPIGIDTCTTATLSGHKEDFVGNLKSVKGMRLKGVGGSIPIAKRGTFRMVFMDDEGKSKSFDVKNAYYVPKLSLRLLSPQQWSQQGPRNEDGSYVRFISTVGETTILNFEGGTKTVTHNPQNNLPILHTRPGYKAFSTYLTENKQFGNVFALPTNESAENVKNEKVNLQKDFDLAFDKKIDELEQQNLPELSERDIRNEFLKWHYKLGHAPFKVIQEMASRKLIDPRLASVKDFPFCPGCQYGKQSRKAWPNL